jgi:hypothetical protein
MIHAATTLYLNETVKPNPNIKKQYGLKAGLKKIRTWQRGSN